MKKLKRIFYSILTLFLAFFMASCGNDNDFSTEYTDNLILETEYENKTFMADGIESVTLFQAVDGDTAHFQDANRNTLKIRFLAVNTPESTGQIAPWGGEASAFTKSKLENAVEIVVESEVVGQAPEVDSTGDRYLAYIWYRPSKNAEFRNLNLELIEASFSFFIGLEDNLKYGETFRKAYLEVYPSRKRVFGELDPNFDYSGKTIATSIADIRYNLSSFSTGTNLKITARVVRLVGNSLYIEDLEETYIEDLGKSVKGGIFLYHSFVSALGKKKPGDVLEFECQASDSETYGFQLVNARNIRTKEEGTAVNIQDLPDDVTSLKDYEGLVVRVNEFTVTSVGNQNEETKAYTIYGVLKNGTKIQVRVDADTSPKLSYSVPEEGKTFVVTGGVSRYVDFFNDGEVIYQIKLGNQKEVGLEDFKLKQ